MSPHTFLGIGFLKMLELSSFSMCNQEEAELSGSVCYKQADWLTKK